MIVTFKHAQNETDNIKTFFFEPESPVHYTAGQFVELVLPHHVPDDRGIKRWFTLSSSPTEELLSITTKIAEQNGSSFKTALQALLPGDRLIMSDPMGDFVLPKDPTTPLVFVAGGIGITPFHSILTWLVDKGETRPIKFLYAVRHEDEIIFQDTFDRAGIKPTISVSEPSDSWTGERSRLTADLILGLKKPADNTLVYISGPEPMVESLSKDLTAKGLGEQQIVGDYFPGYEDAYSDASPIAAAN